jgi:hypothetical protein
MRRLLLSVSLAVASLLAIGSAAFAQMAPGGSMTSPGPSMSSSGQMMSGSGGNAVSVTGTDDISGAEGMGLASFVQGVVSDWANTYGWKPSQPITIYLYTDGTLLANAFASFMASPLTSDQMGDVANNESIIATPDKSPGGRGGWAVLVNLNNGAFGGSIGGSTWMNEVQGAVTNQLATLMLQDVAGTGGPQWFRAGLADQLTTMRLTGLLMVNTRAAAVSAAMGEGVVPTISTLNQSWSTVTAPGSGVRDAAFGVTDQAVFLLSQKATLPQLVNVLKRASNGENFDSVLQSVTGYTSSSLDAALTAMGM